MHYHVSIYFLRGGGGKSKSILSPQEIFVQWTNWLGMTCALEHIKHLFTWFGLKANTGLDRESASLLELNTVKPSSWTVANLGVPVQLSPWLGIGTWFLFERKIFICLFMGTSETGSFKNQNYGRFTFDVIQSVMTLKIFGARGSRMTQIKSMNHH